ncbi:hypothetical protein NPIL_384561 [Nephila pilipes]|uniref:Uncharacterized protein n=1 Tax=Nephila pilipes TaxID=299642 RepID=A0A8X6QLF8_NEPPI|nr:hypothetical protein NPIL_384561 [Nephila pilipes]
MKRKISVHLFKREAQKRKSFSPLRTQNEGKRANLEQQMLLLHLAFGEKKESMKTTLISATTTAGLTTDKSDFGFEQILQLISVSTFLKSFYKQVFPIELSHP